MPDVLLYEKKAWTSGFLRVAGVDEAGRGPLAGPVVASSVIFDPDYIKSTLGTEWAKMTDSKAMTESSRNYFFEKLQNCSAVEIGVGQIEASEIDKINILRATHKAMAIAAEKVRAGFILVDGLPVKGLPCGSESIVKGDFWSISISAASVIAKVTRDRIMCELDEEFPEYGFSSHKGYGTKKHLEALKKYGASSAHRKSFRPVAELGQLDLGL